MEQIVSYVPGKTRGSLPLKETGTGHGTKKITEDCNKSASKVRVNKATEIKTYLSLGLDRADCLVPRG